MARPFAVTSNKHPPANEQESPDDEVVMVKGLSRVAVPEAKWVSGVSAIAANALLLEVLTNQSFGVSAAATVGTP